MNTHKEIEREREKFLGKYTDLIEGYLDDTFSLFVDVWQAVGWMQAVEAVRQFAVTKDVLQEIYETVGVYFAVDLYGELSQKRLKATGRGALLALVMLWFSDESDKKVDQINDYSASLLAAIALEATSEMADGDSISVIEIARMRTAWNAIKISRAERIAMTEVWSASNVGRQAGAQQVATESPGKAEKKVWLSVLDSHVREAHADVHGTELELNGIFSVGGEQMRFPQDTKYGATGKNIINCRCAIRYPNTSPASGV